MKRLTASDICNIIKACQDSAVKRVVYGDLTIELGSPADEIAAQSNFNLPESNFPKQLDEAPQQTSFSIDDDLLVVEDPVEYERRQLEGDDGIEGRDNDLKAQRALQ
jgi:hypothetical protein